MFGFEKLSKLLALGKLSKLFAIGQSPENLGFSNVLHDHIFVMHLRLDAWHLTSMYFRRRFCIALSGYAPQIDRLPRSTDSPDRQTPEVPIPQRLRTASKVCEKRTMSICPCKTHAGKGLFTFFPESSVNRNLHFRQTRACVDVLSPRHTTTYDIPNRQWHTVCMSVFSCFWPSQSLNSEE